jgi:hypothetical protein
MGVPEISFRYKNSWLKFAPEASVIEKRASEMLQMPRLPRGPREFVGDGVPFAGNPSNAGV